MGEALFDIHLALFSTVSTRAIYGAARRRVRDPSVGTDTALVLDGFPRSANTYAYAALLHSNEACLNVSHRLHSAANFIWGIRHDIPAIVLFRDPAGVVRSFIRSLGVSAAHGLRRYVDLDERLLPYRDCFVVSESSETTRGFGSVI